ncbi:MAG: DnaJ domain-containing protein [Spirochaetaceae bacterium]|nr:DnaJ domain-containing protein [Spirochaetaceae bacterium]
MELRRALTMFRLRGQVPMEDLNSSFRELVKKYHPDKVREYPEWAHERMAEINDAYETLAAWLAKPQFQAKKEDGIEETYRSENDMDHREDPVEGIFRKIPPPLSAGEEKSFYPIFNRFLDGLGIYFQYGLDNPVYRGEGVRRFRFREASRNVKKARDDLEKISKKNLHPLIKAAARFARLTVAEMDLGEPVFQDRMTFRRFDDRLRSARRSFDDAIKEILFPELIPKHLRGRATAGMYVCYTAFVLYLTVFTEGDRRNVGILMTARYDAFMDLVEMRNDGILRF